MGRPKSASHLSARKKIIDTLLATKNQTKTSVLLRVSFTLVNRVLHLASERGVERRQIDQIESLSIDEKSFHKGHSYVTVLSEPETGRILDIAEGRTKTYTSVMLHQNLTEKQMSEIKTVSMDMWPAFISSVMEELPKAKICHDKFHLVKYLNEAVDKVRRRETKNQTELKNSRYVWLKNPENLTSNQKDLFNALSNSNLHTAYAYHQKENFRSIEFKKSIKVAIELFINWVSDVKKSAIPEMVKVANMFEKHKTGIVNSMILGKNNGMAERLNGKIQELKVSARGYRSFENFKSAILFFYGKLDLYPQYSE